MIISRTPYRISFFGGGTDYPVWYREHGGQVLATTIDKYCYLTCRYLPPFFDFKSRILYSKVELVKNPTEIQHPAVREALKYLKINDGVEIHHDGDLPARSGIGSSSVFAVGILHALYALKQTMATKSTLAKTAIHIERDILKENVGSQDQIMAAYGGFNKIVFYPNDSFSVTPVIISRQRLEELQDHLMLFFTGFVRTSSDIAKEQIVNTPNRTKELKAMHQLVDAGIEALGSKNPADFGKLLHEGWRLKKSMHSKISNSEIDAIYDAARKAGAIGGKLIGAGGGGFLLLFAKPESHAKIKKTLSKFLQVPFRFDSSGSQIIFYHPNWPTNGKNPGKIRE